MVVKKFRGIVGPKGLPPEVVQAWEAGVTKALLDPEFQKWYKSASLIPAFMTHDEFATFMGSVVTGAGGLLQGVRHHVGGLSR